MIYSIQAQRNDWVGSQPEELTSLHNMEADACADALVDAFAEVDASVATLDETGSRPDEQMDICLRPCGGLYSSDFLELFQRNASAAEGDALDFPDPPTGGFAPSPETSAVESPEAQFPTGFSDWTPSSGRKTSRERTENEEADELIQVLHWI